MVNDNDNPGSNSSGDQRQIKGTGNTSNNAFTNNLKMDVKFKGQGIDAMHINSAREMVKLHTRDRVPPQLGQARPGLGQGQRQVPGVGKGLQNQNQNQNQNQIQNQNHTPVFSSFPKPKATKMSVPAKDHHGQCNNPQCSHCGSVIIPSPKSSFPIQDEPSITINDWSIYTIKRPILNSQELDELEERYDLPLPEMIFGNNRVRLINDKTKSIIEFNALDALDSLNNKSDFKVSYHKEWLDSRRNNSLSTESSDAKAEKAFKEHSNKDLNKLTNLETIKNYDWTYSTNYKGTITNMEFYPTTEKFPIDRLLKPDPILFFDESILFEDELGDNGISMLSTKIRVMPTCLLLLCRLFLRIDNVIFRIRDTRIFIDLDTNKVLREYKQQDCSYSEVMNKVSFKNAKDPKSLLRDSNWVSQNIPTLTCELETNQRD